MGLKSGTKLLYDPPLNCPIKALNCSSPVCIYTYLYNYDFINTNNTDIDIKMYTV